MKFLFHNDKSTFKDELFLALFILACIGAGLMLIIFSPENWIISNSTFKGFGIIFVFTGVMFIPGLIYRLFSNDTGTKKK